MPFVSVSHSNTDALTVASPQSGLSSERIRLTGGWLSLNTAGSVQFCSGGAGNTALSGNFNLAANTPFVLPASPADPGSGVRHGYLQSAAGESLKLFIAANTAVRGALEYVVVSE